MQCLCGLIAAVNASLTEDDRDLLRHRGPDDAGLMSLQVGSHAVTLGHRRLAIVDLSAAGHQPMESGDGSAVLVYNGEVYNHADLRRELPGQAFRGHSDTETVLHWLGAHGPAGCARLNGIFALAYVDRRAQKLVLARDHFGVKPLYYALVGNRFVAASELAPLLKLMPAAVDPDSIPLLLRMRYLPAPYTLYKGIYKVRPGHFVQVDLSGPVLTVIERPYAVPEPHSESRISYRDAIDQYLAGVEQAVSRQMMADTEVGILLSGGVDSALVAHYASRHSPGRLKAFTIGFDGENEENEIEEARATAAVTGVEFHHRRIGMDHFLGGLEKIVGIVGEPLATTSMIPMHFLAELAAEHVKVVLSGQGADEPLGGYGRYRGYLLAGLMPSFLAPLARRIVQAAGIHNDQLTRGIESLAMADEGDRLLTTWQVFAPDEIERLTGRRDERSREVLDYAYRTWNCAELSSPVARMMRLDLRMGLPDDLLLYTDRITMRHSLECRVPYLDTDLVSFIESLPLRFKVTPSGGKRVHLAAASRVLPPEIVRRRKMGFASPTRAWFADSDRLRGIFAERGSGLNRFVDPAGVERVIRAHAAGINQERQIFLLLTLAFAL